MSKGRLLILGGAAAALLLGGAALALGLAEGLAPLWGFGVVCLLLLPGSLSLAARVQDGFSNRGLERERIIGRAVAILQRLVALGLRLFLAGQALARATTVAAASCGGCGGGCGC